MSVVTYGEMSGDVKTSKLFSGDVLTWSEEDYFGASSEHMPTSPDTVCFENHLLVPDLHEHNVWSFDSDFFGDKTFGEHETVKFFEQMQTMDKKHSTNFSVENIEVNPVTISTVVAVTPINKLKVNKKRSKANSSDSEDSASETRSKKAKASPKLPRSRLPTSAFRGVSRCTKDGRWQARIRVSKEVVYLGRFPTEEQAARRYDEAARLHHGKAAMLNFVTPDDLVMGRKSVFSEKNATVQEE